MGKAKVITFSILSSLFRLFLLLSFMDNTLQKRFFLFIVLFILILLLKCQKKRRSNNDDESFNSDLMSGWNSKSCAQRLERIPPPFSPFSCLYALQSGFAQNYSTLYFPDLSDGI